MNKKEAKEIVNNCEEWHQDWRDGYTHPEGHQIPTTIALDGEFTPLQLEAIVRISPDQPTDERMMAALASGVDYGQTHESATPVWSIREDQTTIGLEGQFTLEQLQALIHFHPSNHDG